MCEQKPASEDLVTGSGPQGTPVEPAPDLPPRLVVGLGNPGDRYAGNRHNIGFMVLDLLAGRLGRGFVERGAGYLSTATTGRDDDLVLLKPLTYMNLSGEAVAAWLAEHGHRGHPERILVVCDDLALPLGTVRLRGKGSSGGQNGLASIIEHLQSEGFARLRLGVDGTEGSLQPEDWPDYVLADFEPGERDLAHALVQAGAEAVLGWAEDGVERTASRCNGPLDLPLDD